MAAFHHALQHLERMEAIGIHWPVAQGEPGLEFGTYGILQHRFTNANRDGRAGHERDAQFLRAVIHGFGFWPRVGEMLVGEDGHRTASTLDDVEDLVEEFRARVEVLAEIIDGVVAMFAHQDDRVDGEFGAPGAERFANGGEDTKAMPGGEIARQIVGGDLVGIERHHPGARRLPNAIRRIAAQQAAHNDIRVRPVPIFSDNGCHARRRFRHQVPIHCGQPSEPAKSRRSNMKRV